MHHLLASGVVPLLALATWTPTPTPTPAPVVAAAGDIACDPSSGSFNGGAGTATSCRQRATSDLLLAPKPTRVLTLGDNQYENATLAKFQVSYHPSWGRLKSITSPAVGNHEYLTAGAAGHFDYFGAAAGDRTKGYYSFNLGTTWHLIALNSNCSAVGGCGAGSPQEKWLRADLAAHPAACALAYWHHPRWSSGEHGSQTSMAALWKALDDFRADVVLSGHDHSYERFAPQTPAGVATANGIRQFVVGTGGKSHYALRSRLPNSEVFNSGTFGVLRVALQRSSYKWSFVPEAGKTFADSGSSSCR